MLPGPPATPSATPWRQQASSFNRRTKAEAELQNTSDQMDEALATARAKLVEARNASDEDWRQNVKPALDAALQKSERLYENVYALFGNG